MRRSLATSCWRLPGGGVAGSLVSVVVTAGTSSFKSGSNPMSELLFLWRPTRGAVALYWVGIGLAVVVVMLLLNAGVVIVDQLRLRLYSNVVEWREGGEVRSTDASARFWFCAETAPVSSFIFERGLTRFI